MDERGCSFNAAVDLYRKEKSKSSSKLPKGFWKWAIAIVAAAIVVLLHVRFAVMWPVDVVLVLVLLGVAFLAGAKTSRVRRDTGLQKTSQDVAGGGKYRWIIPAGALLGVGVVITLIVLARSDINLTGRFGGREAQRYAAYYPAAVELKGFDEPSEEFVTPPGTTYQFEGPAGTEVLFSDGTRGPITKNFGVKRGIFRFFGPKGEKVFVKYW